MIRNGWNVDVDFSNGEDREDENVKTQLCTTKKFYGYKGGEQVGRIYTTLKGSGKIILWYGNCYVTGRVTVSLNGVEIDGTSKKQYTWISFQYRKGDFLEIKELKLAIIQLHELILLDGGSYFN